MSTLFQLLRVTAKDMILEDDAKTIEETYTSIESLLDEMNTYAESFGKSIVQENEKEVYQSYLIVIDTYKEELEGLYELCKQNKDDEAYAYTKGELMTLSNSLRSSIENLVDLKIEGADNQNTSNGEAAELAILAMTGVIAGAIVIAIALGIFISRTISNPTRKLVAAADKIADGDLDVNNLNEVISNINDAAEQVASGSKQISDSSIVLSQGATEQASTVEQLTASVEEIAAQTKLNAENSNQANSLAELAKTNAIQGNIQMQDMLKAMDAINQSSNNISKIIKVIDEIAFQTNILALNAAVEAARAGQYGKGFAVVAEEVRNLAARSANAAKETTEMIGDSIKNVQGGTALAKQTSEALNKIVDDVTQVASLIVDIAAASNEQATGIAQVNQGIMQVSEVVQTTSATSEEGAAASEELSSQAEMLKEQVSRFQLKKTGSYSMTYGGRDELNYGVSNLLDNISEKSKGHSTPKESSESTHVPKRIILSDSEFGKY